MAKPKQTKTVTLVGSGNLAHAVATLLPRVGYEIVEIVTRSDSQKAKALARAVGTSSTTVTRTRWTGEIIWFAVSDGAIRGLASTLAKRTNWEGKIAIHSSGALSSQDLSPLRRRGAHTASAHPMMTFVPGETPEMSGVVWAVEGDPVAVKSARRIVQALGGRALKIDSKYKPLYHAFGAFLSPLLVVHLTTASELAIKAGIPRRDLTGLMAPIVERTLANLFANISHPDGAGKAFSGPLIRGDVETIRTHLRSLRPIPAARNLYVALVESAIASNLPVKNRREISRLIEKMA